jgi:hypothetical protein
MSNSYGYGCASSRRGLEGLIEGFWLLPTPGMYYLNRKKNLEDDCGVMEDGLSRICIKWDALSKRMSDGCLG